MTCSRRHTLLTAMLALSSCTEANGDNERGASDATGSTSGLGTSTGTTTSTSDDDSSGVAETTGDNLDPATFFVSIAGLWVAPVTSWTSAGSFPTMNMDVRAASEGVLFSRVDLDADNNLRFAFAVEEHDGQPRLTFRNGGEFLGVLRDTRTVLHESDGSTWRFCALAGGCAYVDARFDFSEAQRLRLEVDVLGTRHIEWDATRREQRALGGAFPNPPPQPGDAPFPPMPTLDVHASWRTPLTAPADVWVVLTTTECGLDPLNNCVPSRFMKATADAGATEVSLSVEQVHPGTLHANAVLDRNQNLTSAALLPDADDAVSVPLDTTVVINPEAPNALDLVFVDL